MEIRKTLTTFYSSGTKRLLTFLDIFFFFDTKRETQFLLCWLFLHRSSVNSPAVLSAQSQNLNSLTQQTHAHPVHHNWTGLAQVRISTGPAQRQISTNCFFFSKSLRIPAHRFRAWRHSHASPISYLRFLLWHLWLSHPPRTSVNCTQCVHLHVH